MIGAYYGEEAIPYHLRENVENSRKLRNLAEKLYEIVEKQVNFTGYSRYESKD